MILVILSLLRLVQFIVFARVMLTWFMPKPHSALMPITNRIDSILKPFQVVIPVNERARVDIGPMLFLLLLEVVGRLLISLSTSGLL